MLLRTPPGSMEGDNQVTAAPGSMDPSTAVPGSMEGDNPNPNLGSVDPSAAPGSSTDPPAAPGSVDPPAAHIDALLAYLDMRLCVPRDMGAPAAAAIRALPRWQDGERPPPSPVSVSVNRF